MDTCDVLIIGGGPSGSACATSLRRAGLDVVVLDKATFPRDKVCAGWITPQVLEDLGIDADDYRSSRTFQPITAFRVGVIGTDDFVEVDYDRPVSFGIRRCEFDHYLLQRSQARLDLGNGVSSFRRDGTNWVVNESLRAPMLVGAGGHFCPVARTLNGPTDAAPLIAAQEVEFAEDSPDDPSVKTSAERPELYFCSDFTGYGWCFRKQRYLNIGFGRLDPHGVPRATAAFVDFLKRIGRIPAGAAWRMRGHAYLLAAVAGRRTVDDGVVLIGDAAGLAYPQSGEGIRPAIESGLMAASTILAAQKNYTRERLSSYAESIDRRFGVSTTANLLTRMVPGRLTVGCARRLLLRPWFVRHLVLDRWFLHAQEPALACEEAEGTEGAECFSPPDRLVPKSGP